MGGAVGEPILEVNIEVFTIGREHQGRVADVKAV
jgi:hypothetical protein